MAKQKVNEIQVESSSLTADDERLEKLFDDMESGSQEKLEEAARQIITLSTTLLAAFFGLLAFKDAPTYLSNTDVKVLGSLALFAFLLSLFFSLRAVSPRKYDFPRANLTTKRIILEEMLTRKYSAVRWATWIFGIGAFLMLAAALDILIFRI